MPGNPLPETLELYVRSLSSSTTGVRLESIIDRLSALADAGDIDDFTVMVWGERVSTDSAVAQTDAGATIRRRVTEFRRWAAEHGTTLEGGFETRTVHSAITGETHEFITLPSMALAARRDGELEWVVPSADETGTTAPMDRLNAIARDQPEQTPGRALASSDD